MKQKIGYLSGSPTWRHSFSMQTASIINTAAKSTMGITKMLSGRKLTAVCSALAIAAVSAPANAASFIFNVNYDDAGVATLAPGSGDLQTIDLVAGDMFTYTLTATGVNSWTVLDDFSPSFTFALLALDEGSRTVDVDLNLNLNGSSVFSQSDSGIINEEVHLGPNNTPLAAGLQFDQVTFDLTILNAVDLNDPNIDITSRIGSLLPIFGAPEQEAQIDFGPLAMGAVPEPATWAMLICGFGMIGGAMRRQRKANVKVSFT